MTSSNAFTQIYFQPDLHEHIPQRDVKYKIFETSDPCSAGRLLIQECDRKIFHLNCLDSLNSHMIKITPGNTMQMNIELLPPAFLHDYLWTGNRFRYNNDESPFRISFPTFQAPIDFIEGSGCQRMFIRNGNLIKGDNSTRISVFDGKRVKSARFS